MDELRALAGEEFGYLTTTGRRTGRPHTIEIWFAHGGDGPALYMLAGGGYDADWVRNIQREPQVSIRIGSRTFTGRGRVVADPAEESLARRAVVMKYYGRDELHSEGWEVEALPVAIDVDG